MSASPERKLKIASLENYHVRYDLPTVIEEAQQDYNRALASGPRLLNQTEISARFRKARTARPRPQ